MRRAAETCAALVLLLGLAVPASAVAQRAYVADLATDSVALVDTAANAPLGSIPVGDEPVDVAIAPDATRAYVVNLGDETVSVVDAGTGSVGPAIPVGSEPRAIAISPDGHFAYVANSGDDSVTVIDAGTGGVSGPPIAVGDQPEGVAVMPDGKRLLVGQRGGGVAIVDLASRAVIGTVPDGLGPAKLVLTPDGSRGLVANASSSSVSVFSTISATVFGVPVLVGANPGGVAISPSGFAYASSTSNNTVTAIDTATHTKVGPPIGGFGGPKGLAASADGSRVYVANSEIGSLSLLDTGAAIVVGQIPAGTSPQAVAITPDQAPRASFAATLQGKRGTTVQFDASASVDPDGQIATYSWDFGDGQSESGPEPTVSHAYAEPGSYRVTVTATDAEGCSTTLFFTGQTVTCNGSAAAAASSSVKVPDRVKPKFRLIGSPRQRLGRSITLVALCPDETCTVTAKGTLRTSTLGSRRTRSGKRVRKIVKGKARVRKARARVIDGGQATVTLRLSKRSFATARRALRSGGRASIRVKAVARDTSGNKTPRARTIALIVVRR